MVPTVLAALALALARVDGFPTEQQVLPSVETGSVTEGNGIEEVVEE